MNAKCKVMGPVGPIVSVEGVSMNLLLHRPINKMKKYNLLFTFYRAFSFEEKKLKDI